MPVTGSFKGIALVACAAILWGTTGTAQSFAPLTLSPYWVGAARLLVASVFFIGLLALRDAQNFNTSRLATLPWKLLIVAGISMAGYNLFFFAAVRATSVALGTALALGSGPLWAGLIQVMVTRQLPSTSWWIGVGIAVLGLIIATGAADTPTSLGWQGIALCLLSGASYALYATVTKLIVSQAPPALTTGLVFTLAAIFAMPVAFLLAGQPQFDSGDLAVVLWLGIVATGVAYLLFSVGLKYIGSATGVALALIEPVAAVALAVLVVGERPGSLAIVGMGVVLLGLGLLVRAEVRAVSS